ncbi:MAG: type II toxin-antitoxin system HicB family antitoxin [Thermomicrobiaceae bacterium]
MSDYPLKYEVVIYWSRTDECFVAQMPELPGCMADGETPQGALEKIQMVANEWIETARETGRSVPEPAGRLLSA